MIAVKAHFDGKVIVPDEPVKLPKGKPLRVQVEVIQAAGKKKNGKKAGKESVLDWLVENAVADDDLPADLGYQHDHYLYGLPKKPGPKRRKRPK